MGGESLVIEGWFIGGVGERGQFSVEDIRWIQRSGQDGSSEQRKSDL
jgi:hypothetical protein